MVVGEPAPGRTQTRTVGLVASPRDWRRQLTRYVSDHVPGLLVRVLRDPRAVEGDLDVVVVDDSSTFLNRASVSRLVGSGVAVIGIYDPSEQQGQGQRFLADLGIDDVAVATIPTAELVELIMAVTDTHPVLPDDTQLAQMVGGIPAVTPVHNDPAAKPTREWAAEQGNEQARGLLVAVGGPAATAAVEIGVGLAAALSGGDAPAVLVDVDEISPAVAARLAYRLEPTILDAADVVRHGDADLTRSLTVATDGARGHVPMHVIAGTANPDDWELLGRHHCAEVLEAARAQWARAVAVCGPRLETVGNGIDRYGASQAAIGAADVAIGVCEPSPIGILHGLDWLIEARRLRAGRPVWVAFAGHPKSATQRADLVETLRREAGDELLAGIVFVPFGPEVTAARWEARLVTAGKFHQAISSLAATVSPDVPTGSWWRKLRVR